MRVSRKGNRDPDKWLTVPAQRRAITDWTTRHGHELADLREDIDVSGALDDRPNLEELVAMVEHGQLGGLVVAKVDRFSRDLAYGAMIARRIERAGGTFVAADDGVVIGPDGRDFGGADTAHFLFAQLLSMADMQRRRIVRGWMQVRERHVLERGRHWGATVPFGYARGADTGRLEIHEDTARLVRRAFAMRADGTGCSMIARWMDTRGARTGRGGVPTHRWVMDMLRNRVYLGEARAGALVTVGAHPALVDAGLFAAAARQTGVPRPRPVRDDDQAPALTGLVRCWGCRTVMTGGFAMWQGEKRRVYRCRRRHAHGDCPRPATAAETELLQLVEPVFWRTLLAEAAVRAVRDDAGEGERLLRVVQRCEQSLEALLTSDLAGVDQRLLARSARSQQQALEHARAELDEWERSRGTAPVNVDDLFAAWPGLPPMVRGQLVADVIGAVVVQALEVRRRGHAAPLRGRTAALLLSDLPTDLPRQGRRVSELRSFPPLDDEAVPWVLLGE